MQVSVENTSTLGRRMTVRMDDAQYDRKVRARLTEAARQVRLPGFRPGKVPLREIDRRFGAGIRQEVADELMREAFVTAVGENDLEPAGMPRFETVDDAEDGSFTFTAAFDVLPSVELADLSGERVERPRAEVTDADLEDMVERLREQRRRFEAREARAAEPGDQLLIDFVGRRDGEPFDGGSATDFELTLGQGQLIPGFEDGLTGATPGDVRDVDVTFPDDYQAEHLAGQPARFEVTVKEVREPVLPEIGPEFFAEFDLEDATPEEFREQVRGNMERELAGKVRSRLRDQVMDILLRRHDVEAPANLVANEIAGLREEQLSRFGGRIDPQQAREIMPDELFREAAERRVRLGLIVRAFVEARELRADEARVRERLEDMAQAYERPEEFVQFHLADPSRLEPVRNAVLEDMVIERICDEIEVADVDSNYKEVVQPEPAPGNAAVGTSDDEEQANA